MGGTPDPGSAFRTVLCPSGNQRNGQGDVCVDADFALNFEVTARVDLHDVLVSAALLDSSGHICGDTTLGRLGDLSAGRTAPATVRRIVLTAGGGCDFFRTADSLTTAQLDVRVRSDLSEVAQEFFVARYTFMAPSLSSVPTAPRVTSVCWDSLEVGTGGFCSDLPMAGDKGDYRCLAEDDDGDALTLTLSYESAAGCLTADDCWTFTVTRPARFAPLPVQQQVRQTSPGGPFTLTCRVRDAHGFEVVKSICANCQ